MMMTTMMSRKRQKMLYQGDIFRSVENLKLDIGASEVQIKTGTDDKIHVDDSRNENGNAVQKRLSDDRKTLEITMKMRSSFDFKM